MNSSRKNKWDERAASIRSSIFSFSWGCCERKEAGTNTEPADGDSKHSQAYRRSLKEPWLLATLCTSNGKSSRRCRVELQQLYFSPSQRLWLYQPDPVSIWNRKTVTQKKAFVCGRFQQLNQFRQGRLGQKLLQKHGWVKITYKKLYQLNSYSLAAVTHLNSQKWKSWGTGQVFSRLHSTTAEAVNCHWHTTHL